MMKADTYTVKYRQPGDIFIRTLKGVWRDEFVYAKQETIYNPETKETTTLFGAPMGRAFWDEKDQIHYVSLDAYVLFLPDRQEVKRREASKESGQNIQTRFST